MTADIKAVRATIALPCVHCGKSVTPGDLVHLLGHRQVAHVACDLKARRVISEADAT